MDTNRNFEIVRGTDVSQPWTVTLDQSRSLDGNETWSWTCRKNKGDGAGVLLTLTSAGGTITIDGGTKQPTLVFADSATTEALFPSTNTPEGYQHQLVMTKSSLVEAVAEGVMTVIGSV